MIDLQDRRPVTHGEATTEWVWVDPRNFDTTYLTGDSWNEIRFAWNCADIAPALQQVAMGTLDDLLDMIVEAGGDPAEMRDAELDVGHAIKLLKSMKRLPKRHQTWEGRILLDMTLGAMERFHTHIIREGVSSMDKEFKIEITVQEGDLRNLLLTALDGSVKGSGTGKWGWRVKGPDGRVLRRTLYIEDLIIDGALDSRSTVQLRLDESKWRTLSISRGIRTAPSDWLHGLLTGGADSRDAFIFLQHCLYGEVLHA